MSGTHMTQMERDQISKYSLITDGRRFRIRSIEIEFSEAVGHYQKTRIEPILFHFNTTVWRAIAEWKLVRLRRAEAKRRAERNAVWEVC